MAQFVRVGAVIDDVLKIAGVGKRVKGGLVIEMWPRIVGEALAGRTAAAFVRSGVIFVRCSSPALAHQLTYMKAGFLAAIEKKVGPGVIRDIHFQVGETPSQSHASSAPRPVYRELDPSEAARIEGYAHDLEGELHDAFVKWARMVQRMRKTRDAEGWKTCPDCGYQHDRKECPHCADKEKIERIEMIRRQLGEHPWWKPADVARETGTLSPDDFGKARRQLLDTWGREISAIARPLAGTRPDTLRLKALVLKYMVLFEGHVPKELEPERIARVLGKPVALLLFGEKPSGVVR